MQLTNKIEEIEQRPNETLTSIHGLNRYVSFSDNY